MFMMSSFGISHTGNYPGIGDWPIPNPMFHEIFIRICCEVHLPFCPFLFIFNFVMRQRFAVRLPLSSPLPDVAFFFFYFHT